MYQPGSSPRRLRMRLPERSHRCCHLTGLRVLGDGAASPAGAAPMRAARSAGRTGANCAGRRRCGRMHTDTTIPRTGLKIPVSGVQFSPCPPFLLPAKRRNPALGVAFRHFGSRESFVTGCDPLGWFLTAYWPPFDPPFRESLSRIRGPPRVSCVLRPVAQGPRAVRLLVRRQRLRRQRLRAGPTEPAPRIRTIRPRTDSPGLGS